MITPIYKLLPNALKERVKQSDFFAHRKAIRLASSSKRIDICSAQFAHILHLSKHGPIEGKICLEIGSGWVLTHALVCYLLGAKRVIATDIVPCAWPDTILLALKKAIASIPRDILAPFSDYSLIRERFDRLLSISRFSFDALKELGIEYQSPVDFTIEKATTPVDFVYSNSVLEHIPKHDVPALLNNIVSSLNQGGTMIHCIHLEDHKDANRYPFEFLGISENQYTRKLETARGNRIRCSEWKTIFSSIENSSTDFIYRYSRSDVGLPETVDKSVSYDDEHDLRISHVGVYTRKQD